MASLHTSYVTSFFLYFLIVLLSRGWARILGEQTFFLSQFLFEIQLIKDEEARI